MPRSSRLQTLSSELLAFLLAATCAGCRVPETMLCGRCREAIRPSVRELSTPQGLPVFAALSFESVAASCIRRLKDGGETLVAGPLGLALAAALDLARSRVASDRQQVAIVPVPTSRQAFRRRGYRVPELLLRRAGEVPIGFSCSVRGETSAVSTRCNACRTCEGRCARDAPGTDAGSSSWMTS